MWCKKVIQVVIASSVFKYVSGELSSLALDECSNKAIFCVLVRISVSM